MGNKTNTEQAQRFFETGQGQYGEEAFLHG